MIFMVQLKYWDGRATSLTLEDGTIYSGIVKLNVFVDYDKEADVLYVNFGKPQKADNAIQGKDGIIKRKKGNKIIGLTILNASNFND